MYFQQSDRASETGGSPSVRFRTFFVVVRRGAGGVETSNRGRVCGRMMLDEEYRVGGLGCVESC